jgi:acetoin:2,6-dichlorophenolindophenol oxidoreductase subunit alpha
MDTEDARRLLGSMWTIRAFEERLAELVASKQLPGLVHLSIGQEATATGTCATLRADDYVYTGHRPDGPFIARGADLNRLMAELAGRATGYCHGKAGSMHLVDVEHGLLSATGIVGGNLPLGIGSAVVCQERGAGQVVVVFFGDGASNAGYFHESLNLASLWRLPLIFVCENNGYAEFTPLSAHTNIERLAVHAEKYGIPTATLDGQDVLVVRAAVQNAVDRARAGGGPTFLECLTYRLSGHYVGDPQRYREAAELAEWQERDPITRFRRHLAAAGLLAPPPPSSLRAAPANPGGEPVAGEARLPPALGGGGGPLSGGGGGPWAVDEAALERDARERVEAAVRYALDGPWPNPDEVATEVYA